MAFKVTTTTMSETPIFYSVLKDLGLPSAKPPKKITRAQASAHAADSKKICDAILAGFEKAEASA